MPHSVGAFLKGVGIADVKLDSNNHLLVYLDNGKVLDAGQVPASDDAFDATSERPVQNKIITAELDRIVNTLLAEAVGNITTLQQTKVDKISGKGLSTKDFTSAHEAKLNSLHNYDDTTLRAELTALSNRLTALVGGNANEAINSFNEIIAFLNGVEDSDSLNGILAGIGTRIAAAEARITAVEVKQREIEGAIADYDAQIESLDGRVDAQYNEIALIKGNQQTASAQISYLQQRMNSAEADIDSLEIKTATNAGSITSLNNRLSKAEALTRKVEDGSVVVENTLSEVKADSPRPVSGKGVASAIEAEHRNIRTVINGYLDVNTGNHSGSSAQNTIYCPTFFKVNGNTSYQMQGLNGLLNTVYLYDANKSYVGYTGYFVNADIFDIPADVHYIRIALRVPEGTLTKDSFDYDIWFECLNTVEVLNAFHPYKLSIIGDSISTYNANGYKIDGYSMYYPNTLITNVHHTYWKRLLDACGGDIEVNASYSGSLVTNSRASLGYPSLCDRVSLIGSPDTIIVALGTNDSGDGVAIGDYDFSTDLSGLSEATFRTAYIKGIKSLQTEYPNAQIVSLILRMKDEYSNSIKYIADKLGVICVECRDYDSPDGKHPSYKGMMQIGNALSNYLLGNQIAKCGNDIASLKKNTELSFEIPFTGSYINTDVAVGTKVDMTPIANNYAYRLALDVEEGMELTIYGNGMGGGRLWAFVDKDDLLISKSDGYLNAPEGLTITAPVGAAKLIVHTYGAAPIRKVVGNFPLEELVNRIDSLNDVTFQGYFSTNSNSDNYYDKIMTAGLYIRKDANLSRGGLLFVSVITGGDICQRYEEVSSAGEINIMERTYSASTSTWSAWVYNRAQLALIPFTTSGDVTFTDNAIILSGYLYYNYLSNDADRKSIAPGTYPLNSLDGTITRLIYNVANATFYFASAGGKYDEKNYITVGFVVKDSANKVKRLIGNIAANNIYYNSKEGEVLPYDYNPSAIKYIPHRGVCDAEIPENTTYSVMWAAIYGLMYSECDVRYTSDGVGVVMHDTTINRTMVNADGTAISGDVTVAGSTLAALQTYKYKTTNPAYASAISTMREYIDACAQWNVCPIIQGSMSDDDLAYCMQRLGDNWICYGGNFAKVRAYSDKVLCLTSATYNTTEAMITALKVIGGRVGYSQLSNETLTDDIITACRTNRFEVMASYAYDVANIPDAIRRGCTIVLANNVGKAATALLATSLGGWDAFTHTGQVSNGALSLGSGQNLNYKVDKKGSYRIHIEFEGNGTITLPTYASDASYRPTTFALANGVFDMTFLKVDTSAYTISVDTTNSLKIKNITICYE